MIKINLLATEREQKKKKAASTFGPAQRVMALCVVILVATLGALGWRYWQLQQQSNQLDAEITAAQQEVTRLHSLIVQVQQFEQRKAQLQQRVQLIEELRKGQTGPVHMLDQISKALPQMMWLTNLKQAAADITIEGRTTNVTAVSDFVVNLEATGYFKRSIEVVDTRTETMAQPPGQLVRFVLKATFQQPGAAAPAAPAATKTGG